jgi:signal transduction histidine kinase
MILIIQIVSLVSLMIGFSYVIFRNVADYKENMKNNAIINANLVSEYCAVPLVFNVPGTAKESLDKLKSIPSIQVGIIFNADNEVFAEFYKGNQLNMHEIPNDSEPVSYFEADFLNVFQKIKYKEKVVGTIYLKISTNELNQRINNYLMAMLFVLIGIIILNTGLALWLQRILSVPILNLTKATRRISEEGDYQLRVEKKGNDEIGMLVDAYNNMLEQIFVREESLKQKTSELTVALDDLRKTQRKLIDVEKMAALGQLIAGVAHEINTPLGAIRSSVGNIKNSIADFKEYPSFILQLPEHLKTTFFLLVEDSLKNHVLLTSKEERVYKKKVTIALEEHKVENANSIADTLVDMLIFDHIEKYIELFQANDVDSILNMAYKLTGLQRSTENIDFAASRASKVVFALKNYSRISHSVEKELANITEGIETVFLLYSNQIKQGIEVSKNFERIPEILCYPDELNQIWTNILHNAIYAMDLKGKLDVRAYVENDFVVVSITDSGKGIPPEDIKEIFNPFFSTKPIGEGTGIGLDIVKRIVEKHDGKIEVESIPGKTTFRVFLPIHASDNEQENA